MLQWTHQRVSGNLTAPLSDPPCSFSQALNNTSGDALPPTPLSSSSSGGSTWSAHDHRNVKLAILLPVVPLLPVLLIGLLVCRCARLRRLRRETFNTNLYGDQEAGSRGAEEGASRTAHRGM